MFCNNCGNKLKDDDIYCSKCGVKIENNKQTNTIEKDKAENKNPKPETKKKSNSEDYDSEMILIGWVGTIIYFILAVLKCFIFKGEGYLIWGMLLFALCIADGILTMLKPKGILAKIVFFVINFPAGFIYVFGIFN